MSFNRNLTIESKMRRARLIVNNFTSGTMILCEDSALGKEFQIVGLILMVSIMIFGVLGNSLVCVSVIKYFFLRKLSNYLVFSLAVADILVGVTVLPFDVVYWIQFPRWSLGGYACNLWNSLFFLCLTASIFNLLAISGDRFVAVVFPLKYPDLMTITTTKGVVIAVWSYSTIIGVLLFAFLVPPSGEFYTFELDTSFYSFLLLGNVLFPFGLMMILYLKIYIIARKHARKIAGVSQTSTQARLSAVLSRELRVARTLGIVVCCFVLCWLPFLVINVKIVVDAGVESCDMEIIDTAVCWLAYLNCTLNPVLYAAVSPDFRRAFRGILCFWKSIETQRKLHHDTPSFQPSRGKDGEEDGL